MVSACVRPSGLVVSWCFARVWLLRGCGVATDYDAPRVREADDAAVDVQVASAQAQLAALASRVDVDEVELAEALELPGADLSSVALDVAVVPVLRDEFTCTGCFLVQHASRRVGGSMVCLDCS